MRPASLQQPEEPTEYKVSWTRTNWAGRRKSKTFAHLEAAERLAAALLGEPKRPDVTQATDVQIRRRVVGDWVLVSRVKK